MISGSVRVSGLTNAFPPKAWSSPSVTFTDTGLENVFPPALSRRTESKVVVLPFKPGNVCPSLCPVPFDIESQARPAALDDAGGGLNRPAEDLGDFEGFLLSLVRNVVSMALPFFSGLGVLEVLF